MQISYNWLKQYVPFNMEVKDVAEVLTNTGLEVEDIQPWESVKGGLRNVVIGEIISCEKHPDADKLQITKVDIGEGELLQIVCGAPNARIGVKSPIALVGARLFPIGAEDAIVIKKSKIRGVESFGMICAEDELGLSDSHAGIMELPVDTKVGVPAAEYFEIENDFIISIGLTPNRSDAFSHIGVARDLRAALSAVYNIDLPLQTPSTKAVGAYVNPIKITIKDSAKCGRYSGIYIKDVHVKSSPKWLQNRLRAIGIKPINNIVDVTNFVLNEFGQPLHAFDADKISGNIIVQTVEDGTKFVTLDNVERKLSAEDLMICDSEKPLCIAGVYGGLGSGVTNETKNVFLESAFFDSTSIRKTAQRHELRTDASQRYEKITDINIVQQAAYRAALLISEVAGGTISQIEDVYPNVVNNAIVTTSYTRINDLSGTKLPREKVNKILSNLEIEVVEKNEQDIQLSVPTFRVEVTREADVVEEILRIYGYNNIPMPKHLRSSLSFSSKTDNLKWENVAANYFVGAGYFEASTNSITKSKFETDAKLQEQMVRLLNSQTSELDALRTSMIYGLLEVVQHNINFKNLDLKLFEFGKTYRQQTSGDYVQTSHLATLLTGKNTDANWLKKSEKVNFYNIKTDVLNVLKRLVGNIRITVFENESVFSFGIKLFSEEKLIGTIGKVKSSMLKNFDIKQDVFFADILWNEVVEKTQFQKLKFTEIPKYPAVQRDLSMIVDEQLPFRKIEEIAFSENYKLLREVSLFDVYKGDKIESGKKSYAISFTFLDETKTLTEKDIDKAMTRLMEKLEKEGGVQIRKG